MKGRITFLSVLALLLPFLVAHAQGTQAPLSEAFLKYVEQEKKSLSKAYDGERPSGYIPPPVEFKSTIPKSLQKAAELPSIYDPTKMTTILTPVKNQGGCGDCWAFGTIGSVEATWKILGYGTYDLSENHLNNKHGFMGAPCAGGNAGMTTAYFTRGSGPVLESQDPSGANGQPSPEGYIAPAALIDRAYNLPDANSVTNQAELRSFIKQFIYENGPVSTCILQEDKYYNANYCTYYCTEKGINHLVLIVGWNDDKVTAGGTGAWIVKNSWGTGWGAKGYYFVSYNDKSILQGVNYWPTRLEYTGGEKIYMYDDLGMITSWGFGSHTGYGIVKFTADKHKYITKVASYIASGNSTVSFGIYKTFSDAAKSLNPVTTLPAQNCPYAGYYTFDLSVPVLFEEGQDFYIQAKYNTPESYYPVPVESFMDTYSDPKFESKKCWMGGNGKSWEEIGAGKSAQVDLCIRAYGLLDTVKNLAKGKASSVSSYDAGFDSSNVTDGDMSTKWAVSSIDTQYIKIDLGNSYNIKKAVLFWAPAYAQEYKLLASNDDSTWTPAYTETAGDGETDTLNVSVFARYLKVLATKAATSEGYSLYEIQVYAPVNTSQIAVVTDDKKPQTISSYSLGNNYPNPFNPVTKINYELPKSSEVTLKVYDVLGKEVATLFNGSQNAGKHTVEFNGAGLPSGIYFYMLRADNFTQVKKMVLLK